MGCPGQQNRIPPPRAAAPKKGTTAEERESCSGKWVMAVPRAYPVGFTPPQSQTALFKAVLNNPAVPLELGPWKATSARNSTQKSFPYFAPSACPWHLYSFVPGLSAHQGKSWCANQGPTRLPTRNSSLLKERQTSKNVPFWVISGKMGFSVPSCFIFLYVTTQPRNHRQLP